MSKRISKQTSSEDIYSKTTGDTQSLWIGIEKQLFFGKLKKDVSVDVVIVGAGISGVTAAYILTQEGRKVALIDDGAVGSGETGRTTAHLTWALDDRYYHIENLFGAKKAKLAYESHKKAIDLIEKIVKKEKIKCDFERVDGYLYLSANDPKETLDMEMDCFRRLGIKEPKIVDKTPLHFASKAILFPNQAQFHPLKYINALCKVIKKKKGLIFTETHVVKTKPGRIQTKDGFFVHAKKIIIATGSPIKGGNIFIKQASYRSYVVAARIPKGLVEKALYWDTGDKDESRPYSYYYIRVYSLNKKEDILIVGGEDHKTGQPDKDPHKIHEHLENWVRHHFPFVKDFEYKWSGQIIEPVDSMAFIGRNPNPAHKNIYMITGDSGNGMTHGTLGAFLLTDLILGKKNEWTDLYNPSRRTPLAIRPWLREAGNFVSQYKDYFKPGEIKSADGLEKDQGATIRKGITKLAVYKDNRGKVHSFSAVCPHQGCLVKWNSLEKTFDCPCHGSRFTCKGKVITGPATKNLEEKKLD